MRLLSKSIGTSIKWVAIAFIYLTPAVGVWIASSLAAYNNRSASLAVLAGLFLFPVLPLLWELWATRKRRQAERILTWGDRLMLRTLAINFVAIALLLTWQPKLSFIALSTRGDWMLGEMQGESVQVVRKTLFKLANGLEGLYLAFNKNPFERYDDGSSNVKPQPQSDRNPFQDLTRPDVSIPQPTVNSKSGWAWEGMEIHPAVANMPASVETSIDSVAKYIVSKESDPMLRVKALHDYVADRIAYDAESYFAKQYPPQDAETVFRTRKSVCAGYAKLLEALGKAAGEEIVYVVGDARTQTSDLSGQGHAWNAAKVKGQWYLIDATWDSGYVSRAKGFTKNYRTEYLMPPPEVIVISHLPKDPAWQLLSNPISLGEFLRQPMMKPKFFADGLQLISPKRSQTEVSGEAKIVLENPKKQWISAAYSTKGGSQSSSCGQPVQSDRIACNLPASGAYEIRLFTSTESFGKYGYVGQLEFNKS